jgi:hypothetical protein
MAAKPAMMVLLNRTRLVVIKSPADVAPMDKGTLAPNVPVPVLQ